MVCFCHLCVGLDKEVTHYLVPDAQVTTDYLEILEFTELTGIIFTQSVKDYVSVMFKCIFLEMNDQLNCKKICGFYKPLLMHVSEVSNLNRCMYDSPAHVKKDFNIYTYVSINILLILCFLHFNHWLILYLLCNKNIIAWNLMIL